MEKGAYPKVEAVYASPRKRCAQTARILWPDIKIHFCEKLRECDFGEFENKNYLELSGNPRYQEWVDSGGFAPFPGGEGHEEFKSRCRQGFSEALENIREEGYGCAAFVVHGGTIMSILEAWAVPAFDFYHWQAGNGEGFQTYWDETDKGGIRLYETVAFCPDFGVCAGSDLR